MKPTRDKTWKRHLSTGRVIKTFEKEGYRFVFIKVTKQSSFIIYFFRLIVFPINSDNPVLSLNLEENPAANTCCLGAHIASGHVNHGFASKDMLEKDFIDWAMENANKYLQLTLDIFHDQPEETQINDNIESCLIDLIHDLFKLSHEFVDFRKKIKKITGRYLRIFSKINYEELSEEALYFTNDFANLRLVVFNMNTDNFSYNTMALYNALKDHIEDVCDASDIVLKKMELSLEFSKKVWTASWKEFHKVCNIELNTLDKCQISGDKLTSLYHSYITDN